MPPKPEKIATTVQLPNQQSQLRANELTQDWLNWLGDIEPRPSTTTTTLDWLSQLPTTSHQTQLAVNASEEVSRTVDDEAEESKDKESGAKDVGPYFTDKENSQSRTNSEKDEDDEVEEHGGRARAEYDKEAISGSSGAASTPATQRGTQSPTALPLPPDTILDSGRVNTPETWVSQLKLPLAHQHASTPTRSHPREVLHRSLNTPSSSSRAVTSNKMNATTHNPTTLKRASQNQDQTSPQSANILRSNEIVGHASGDRSQGSDSRMLHHQLLAAVNPQEQRGHEQDSRPLSVRAREAREYLQSVRSIETPSSNPAPVHYPPFTTRRKSYHPSPSVPTPTRPKKPRAEARPTPWLDKHLKSLEAQEVGAHSQASQTGWDASPASSSQAQHEAAQPASQRSQRRITYPSPPLHAPTSPYFRTNPVHYLSSSRFETPSLQTNIPVPPQDPLSPTAQPSDLELHLEYSRNMNNKPYWNDEIRGYQVYELAGVGWRRLHNMRRPLTDQELKTLSTIPATGKQMDGMQTVNMFWSPMPLTQERWIQARMATYWLSRLDGKYCRELPRWWMERTAAETREKEQGAERQQSRQGQSQRSEKGERAEPEPNDEPTMEE